MRVDALSLQHPQSDLYEPAHTGSTVIHPMIFSNKVKLYLHVARTALLPSCAAFLIFGSAATLLGTRAIAASAPARVLVVYRANSVDSDHDGVGDSQQLAEYYAQKRSVPASNLLAVSISATYASSYAKGQYGAFYTEVVTPIKSKLTALGTTNIDVILLAGDIPATVYDGSGQALSVDNALMGINVLGAAAGSTISFNANPYFSKAPGFSADAPHFNHASFKYLKTEMYLVTRLGSGSPLRGIDQVAQSIYADRYLYPKAGYYYGTGYVDSQWGQPNGQPYTDAYLGSNANVQTGSYADAGTADLSIAYAEHWVAAAGFPLKWENTTNLARIGDAGAMFSDGTSALAAPRALFYGGWYNFIRYNDVYEWLPGSVACDLNSAPYFGQTALQKGASAALYVVAEPYLTGHQRPQIFYYYILKGYSFAEASALATPYIGWMAVNEGDPLYTPTGVKTPVVDTAAPQLMAGYPAVVLNTATGVPTLKMVVDDSAAPEVVTATVNYGADTNYGSVAKSAPGFSRTPSAPLASTAGQAFHYQVTLTDPVGNTWTSPDYTYTSNGAPTIATAASATPNPVSGTSAAVNALGADDGGESNLTYTWSASGPAAVTFAANGSNAAKSSTATFTKAGAYTLRVLVTDAGGLTATSAVSVSVQQTAAGMKLSPVSATVAVSGTQQFTATVVDQFGNAISQSAITWSLTGSGSISASGLYTAPAVAGGPFTVTAVSGAMSAKSTVTVTATATATATTASAVQPLLLLHADGSEASGTTNGSVITPAVGPAGFKGNVVVNGSGSVNFAPAYSGNGVYFLNCCGNTDNAYYKFTGSAIGSIFGIPQGQVTFYLKSRYSFAQRQSSAARQRYAFDVRDANGHQFYFLTQIVSGQLQFTYNVAGGSQYYFVPKGTEDALFGSGVTLKVKLAWDASAGTVGLFLNDQLVKTTVYPKLTLSWTAASTFDLGAYEYLTAGGYDALDDIIDEFAVGPPGSN